MITMLLGGLWHGASFNFVVWGALHGVALAGHKLYTTHLRPEGTGRFAALTAPVAWLATQAFVLLAWIPFRAKTFAETWIILRGLFSHPAIANAQTVDIPLTLLVLPLVVDQLLVQNPRLPALPVPRNPWVVAAVLGAALAVALPFLPLEVQSFIYFQF